jgi:hypothetical protein
MCEYARVCSDAFALAGLPELLAQRQEMHQRMKARFERDFLVYITVDPTASYYNIMYSASGQYDQ